MQSILTNFGQLIHDAVATEDGRRIIRTLGTQLIAYSAAAAADAHMPVAAAAASPAPAPPAPVAVPPVPAPSPLGPGYVYMKDIIVHIRADIEAFSKMQCGTPVQRAYTISQILWSIGKYSGVLISPKILTAINATIDRLLNDINTIYKDEPWAPLYAAEFTEKRRTFNSHSIYYGVRYSWLATDGSRTTVVGTKRGGFLEIRRGSITGKTLKRAGPRTWGSADELRTYWEENRIQISNVATAK
jgi:hypothetical protein